MRKILFRGKRYDNKEWVEGGYIPLDVDSGYTYIVEPYNYASTLSALDLIKLNSILVVPNTVSQYTGLTDKKGVKIFEGDICRFKRFNDAYVGQIVFNVKTASFVMWYSSTVGAYGEKATHKMLLSVCDEIEVIGNIHDNPEILKNTNP